MLCLIGAFMLVRPAKPIFLLNAARDRTNFFKMWTGSGFEFETHELYRFYQTKKNYEYLQNGLAFRNNLVIEVVKKLDFRVTEKSLRRFPRSSTVASSMKN